MSSNESDRPQIQFDDRHVDAIMDGEKSVTIRYDFEHDFDRGDLVDLINQNGHKLTTAKIVTQCELRADWISFADFEGHRRYTTTGELFEELSEYYPDAPIGPGTVLDVIIFETDLIVTDGGVNESGGTERYRNGKTPETITLELPVWMVKQLRGTARHEKNNWITEGGREDAERIESVLTHYLEERPLDTDTERFGGNADAEM